MDCGGPQCAPCSDGSSLIFGQSRGSVAVIGTSVAAAMVVVAVTLAFVFRRFRAAADADRASATASLSGMKSKSVAAVPAGCTTGDALAVAPSRVGSKVLPSTVNSKSSSLPAAAASKSTPSRAQLPPESASHGGGRPVDVDDNIHPLALDSTTDTPTAVAATGSRSKRVSHVLRHSAAVSAQPAAPAAAAQVGLTGTDSGCGAQVDSSESESAGVASAVDVSGHANTVIVTTGRNIRASVSIPPSRSEAEVDDIRVSSRSGTSESPEPDSESVPVAADAPSGVHCASDSLRGPSRESVPRSGSQAGSDHRLDGDAHASGTSVPPVTSRGSTGNKRRSTASTTRAQVVPAVGHSRPEELPGAVSGATASFKGVLP